MRYFFWLFLIFLLVTRFYFFFTGRPTFPDGTKIRITDRVLTEPIRYSKSQYLKLSGFKFYLPCHPEVFYGDRIVVEGVVEKDRLKQVILIAVEEGGVVLYDLRKKLVAFYKHSLPIPHSSLISGVAIGSKEDIPTDFWEALKRTGTAHVVVASGMNVTLISRFLIGILVLFLARRRAILFALVGIWTYSLISGFDAPIVRAAIMGSLAFTAQELGRLSDAWRVLIISAIIMLLVKPEWIGDLGFILSFVATASLVMFNDGVERMISFVPEIIREDLSTALAAQIGVAPILLFSFGQFNLLSPLINAAVLWTIVPITIIGVVGGIVGLIFEPFGKLLLLLSFPLTSWFIGVVNLFGSV
jgi:competence protein ComEC